LFSPDSNSGQVVEARALEAAYQAQARYTGTLAGYFDNIEDLLREVSKLHTAMGIYLMLQPCHPDLLHRAKNKLVRQKRDATRQISTSPATTGCSLIATQTASLTSPLISLALESCELFTTPKGERDARVQVRWHWESLLLEGKSFQRWLLHSYVTTYGSFPNKTTL